MQASDYSGPGPQERKLRSRLHYWLHGRWPASVVDERLYRHEMRSARDRGDAMNDRGVADPSTSYEVLAPALFGWSIIGTHATAGEAQAQAAGVPGSRVREAGETP